MGHGLLPIVSNIPANMEAIDNGKAGVFFESKNTEELGKLLAYYLNNNEERELMSKKAKERATLVYSWDAIAERTFAVYEKALANKKKNSFHFGFKKMTAEVK
jgi:glycosyltransferase involved in cell wall biosynthesis